MADSLDRSTTAAGLIFRMLAGLALLLIVPPATCVGVHRLRHPAPLGRTETAIRAQLDAALPLGTTLDSAQRFLAAHGVAPDLYRVADAAQSFAQDADWARGPVLIARLPSVDLDLFEWDAIVKLYFTPDGRLAGEKVYLQAVNPL